MNIDVLHSHIFEIVNHYIVVYILWKSFKLKLRVMPEYIFSELFVCILLWGQIFNDYVLNRSSYKICLMDSEHIHLHNMRKLNIRLYFSVQVILLHKVQSLLHEGHSVLNVPFSSSKELNEHVLVVLDLFNSLHLFKLFIDLYLLLCKSLKQPL